MIIATSVSSAHHVKAGGDGDENANNASEDELLRAGDALVLLEVLALQPPVPPVPLLPALHLLLKPLQLLALFALLLRF